MEVRDGGGQVLQQVGSSEGYFHIRRSGGGGGLAPKFASQILVEASNFASKSIGNKYPKFCRLNFRYDPKIRIFPNFCVLW